MNTRSFEPIHVPVEIPGNGIPVTNVPRYELGGPVFDKQKGIKYKLQNKKITDILLALNFLGYIPKPTRPVEKFEDPEPDVLIPPNPRVPTPPVIIIKKKKKKIKKIKKPFSKRNWWRLCKDFINMFIFFSSGRKYSTLYAKERNLKRIYLSVNKHNTPSYEVYLHLGFKVIDAVVTDIGGGFVMDDYIMEYRLR